MLESTAYTGAAPATANYYCFSSMTTPWGTTSGVGTQNTRAPPNPTKFDIEQARFLLKSEGASQHSASERKSSTLESIWERMMEVLDINWLGARDRCNNPVEDQEILSETISQVPELASDLHKAHEIESVRRRGVARSAETTQDVVKNAFEITFNLTPVEENDTEAIVSSVEKYARNVTEWLRPLAAIEPLTKSKWTEFMANGRPILGKLTNSVREKVVAHSITESRLDSSKKVMDHVMTLEALLLDQEPTFTTQKSDSPVEDMYLALRVYLENIAQGGTGVTASAAEKAAELLVQFMMPEDEKNGDGADSREGSEGDRDIEERGETLVFVIDGDGNKVIIGKTKDINGAEAEGIVSSTIAPIVDQTMNEAHRLLQQAHQNQIAFMSNEDVRDVALELQDDTRGTLNRVIDGFQRGQMNLGVQQINEGNRIDQLSELMNDVNRSKEQLEERMQNEINDLEAQLAAEAAATQDEFGREISKKLQERMDALLKRQAAERQAVTDTNILEKMSSIHDEQRRQMEKTLGEEEDRQRELLNRRLEARRKRALAKRKLEHSADIARENLKERYISRELEEAKAASNDLGVEMADEDARIMSSIARIGEEEQKLAEKLEMTPDPQMQMELLKQHESNISNLESVLEQERERQLAAMRTRANERKQRFAQAQQERETLQLTQETQANIKYETELAEAEDMEDRYIEEMRVADETARRTEEDAAKIQANLMEQLDRVVNPAEKLMLLQNCAKNMQMIEARSQKEQERQLDLIQRRSAERQRQRLARQQKAAALRQQKGDTNSILTASDEYQQSLDTELKRTIDETLRNDGTWQDTLPSGKKMTAADRKAIEEDERLLREEEFRITQEEQRIAREVTEEMERIEKEIREKEEEEIRLAEEEAEIRRRELVKMQHERHMQELVSTAGSSVQTGLAEQQEKAMKQMEEFLAEEEDRQRSLRKERIEARMKHRLAQERQRQETRKAERIIALKANRDEMMRKRQKAREEQAVLRTVAEHGETIAANAVQLAMQERFDEETRQLMERQKAERSTAESDVLFRIRQEYADQRDKMQSQHAEEIQVLIASVISPTLLAERRREIEQRQERDRTDFDKMEATATEAEVKEALATLEQRQAMERMDLQRRNLEEMSATIVKLFPDKAAEIQSSLATQKTQIAQTQRQMELEREAVLKQAELEREAIRLKIQAELEEDLRNLDDKIQEDMRQEETRLAELRKEIEEQKKIIHAMKDRGDGDRGADARDGSEGESKASDQQFMPGSKAIAHDILSTHEKVSQQMNEELLNEKRRQLDAVARRREERRRRLVERKQQEMRSKLADAEARTTTRIDTIAITQANLTSAIASGTDAIEATKKAASSISGEEQAAKPESDKASHVDIITASAIPLAPRNITQEASAIQAKLEAYQRFMESSSGYVKVTSKYVDPYDAQIENEGFLDVVQNNQLTPHELEVLTNTRQSLDRVFSIPSSPFPRCTLHLARAIPFTSYSTDGNAFCHSYYFREETDELFIRRERAHMGMLSTVAAHALAHIATGDWSDDSKIFLKNYYTLTEQLNSIMPEALRERAAAAALSHD